MKKIADLLQKNLVIKIPIWLFFLLFTTTYFSWEVYWYSKIGLGFIKWHTHLFQYLILWVIVILLFLLVTGNKQTKDYKFPLIFTSTIFSLFLVEVMLLISGVNKTESEQVLNSYISPYNTSNMRLYHTHNPINKTYCSQTSEFDHCKPVNSLGFVDVEWEIEKDDKEKRIVIFGDSFVEGAGAEFDSSFPFILRNILTQKDSTFSLMNGGVSGSDPVFDYYNLKDLLLVYKPNMVIQVIGSNDLDTDMIMRGGMSRMNNNQLKYNTPPWWEPIYALNYVSRLFFHFFGYTEILTNTNLSKQDTSKLNSELLELFKSYLELVKDNEIAFYVVFRPDPYEVEDNEYTYDFTPLKEELSNHKNVTIIDLLPEYNNYILSKNSNYQEYFWPKDMHHNSKGYKMMAKCVYKTIFKGS